MQRVNANPLELHYAQMRTGHYFIYRLDANRPVDDGIAMAKAFARQVSAGLLTQVEAFELSSLLGRIVANEIF